MSLTEGTLSVQSHGSWPEPIKLRRGWARAEARMWNDEVTDATLRVTRGGGPFIDACTAYLIQVGAPSVLSPPLPASAARTWESVGYQRFAPLTLMRLDLGHTTQTADHLVATDTEGIEALLDIDRAAFDVFWRFDRIGLQEAMDATTATRTLTIAGPDAHPVAYAVVGLGQAISYLQRLAVHPDWQGTGMGRSLVRGAARVARNAGTRAMVLNTQEDNEAAISLYTSEGFVTQQSPLAVLQRR
jgi:ribosomal protein S18 acetylase RimI-like enzyme